MIFGLGKIPEPRFSHGKRGETVIEAVIVLVILSFGIVGTFGLLISGGRLADTTEYRIQAINLAREGIEAVETIRNTNWVKFPIDLENCFDTADYNAGCIGNSAVVKLSSGIPQILVQTGSLWYLTGSASTGSGIAYDIKGLSVQGSGVLPACTSNQPVNCLSKFNRTVTVTAVGAGSTRSLNVKSTVEWKDSSRISPYQITLEETLTNWKKNF